MATEVVIAHVQGYVYPEASVENAIFAEFFQDSRQVDLGSYIYTSSLSYPKNLSLEYLSHHAYPFKIFPYLVTSIREKDVALTAAMTSRSETKVILEGIMADTFPISVHVNRYFQQIDLERIESFGQLGTLLLPIHNSSSEFFPLRLDAVETSWKQALHTQLKEYQSMSRSALLPLESSILKVLLPRLNKNSGIVPPVLGVRIDLNSSSFSPTDVQDALQSLADRLKYRYLRIEARLFAVNRQRSNMQPLHRQSPFAVHGLTARSLPVPIAAADRDNHAAKVFTPISLQTLQRLASQRGCLLHIEDIDFIVEQRPHAVGTGASPNPSQSGNHAESLLDITYQGIQDFQNELQLSLESSAKDEVNVPGLVMVIDSRSAVGSSSSHAAKWSKIFPHLVSPLCHGEEPPSAAPCGFLTEQNVTWTPSALAAINDASGIQSPLELGSASSKIRTFSQWLRQESLLCALQRVHRRSYYNALLGELLTQYLLGPSSETCKKTKAVKVTSKDVSAALQRNDDFVQQHQFFLSNLVISPGDSSSSATTSLLGSNSSRRRSTQSTTVDAVYWSDIGGLDTVRQEILDVLELPFLHPELFPPHAPRRQGVLLYGPPGTGKTLVAKAVATECQMNFLSIKGPELLDSYVGESEKNVREIFAKAQRLAPCVLFFDEIDSLAPARAKRNDSGGGVTDRIVSQLLTELDLVMAQQSRQNGKGRSSGQEMEDRASGPQVFIIAATNRPDLLDAALLRPGRFDRKIYLGVCHDAVSRCSILKAQTRKFSLAEDVDFEDIVTRLLPENVTGADIGAISSSAYSHALTRKLRELDARIRATGDSHPVAIESEYDVTSRGIDFLESLPEEELDVIVCHDDFVQASAQLVPSVVDLGYYEQLYMRYDSNATVKE